MIFDDLCTKLGIEAEEIVATLKKYDGLIPEAAYYVLKGWYKRIGDRKESYKSLKKALCDPQVKLSRIAETALHPETVYLSSGKIFLSSFQRSTYFTDDQMSKKAFTNNNVHVT